MNWKKKLHNCDVIFMELFIRWGCFLTLLYEHDHICCSRRLYYFIIQQVYPFKFNFFSYIINAEYTNKKTYEKLQEKKGGL